MIAKVKALAIIAVGICLSVSAFLVFSGGASVTSLDVNRLNSDANGSLVYASGSLKPKSALEDNLFGVSESDAIGLKRVVEIYQWQEEPDGSYVQEWSEQIIDSSAFAAPQGHENPEKKWIDSLEVLAENTTLGVYSLGDRLQQRVAANDWQPLPYTPEQYNALPASGKKAFKLFDGKLFYGLNPESPNVGDIQISFVRSPAQASIIAELSGDQLIPDTQTGNAVQSVRMGMVSQDVMLESIELPGGMLRWIMVGIGGLISLVGVFLLSRAKHAVNADDMHNADMDEPEFAHEEFDHEEPVVAQPEAVDMPDEIASLAAGVGQDMGAHASNDTDEFGDIAPMTTPGMDNSAASTEQMPTEAVPTTEPSMPQMDTASSMSDDVYDQQESIQGGVEDVDGFDFDSVDSDSATVPVESFEEPSAPEQPQVSEAQPQPEKVSFDNPVEDFQDDSGIDFDMGEEPMSGELQEPVASPDPQSVEMTQVVEEAPQPEQNIEPQSQVATDSTAEVVEPMPDQGYAPADYVESAEDENDGMFLLDDEQEEGGSEPMEVTSDGQQLAAAPVSEEVAPQAESEAVASQDVAGVPDVDEQQSDFAGEEVGDDNDEGDDDEFFFLDDDEDFLIDEDDDEDENDFDLEDDDDFQLDDDFAESEGDVSDQSHAAQPQQSETQVVQPEDAAPSSIVNESSDVVDDEDFPLIDLDAEGSVEGSSDTASNNEESDEKKNKGDSAVEIQEF